MAATPGDPSLSPRRSMRTPAKALSKIPAASSVPLGSSSIPIASGGKRKTRDTEKSPAEKLEYLLTNSKSQLTKVDIGNIINYDNFLELSEESQIRLCALLPPTAFTAYSPSIGPSHPDFPSTSTGRESADKMDIDEPPLIQIPATLDPAVFTSSFFLSASHTFQDHLFSSWVGKKASDDLEKFQRGAAEGTLHADWKDEVWVRDHSEDARPKRKQTTRSLDLRDLAKRGLLQEGDVVAYKRTFPIKGITVKKDLLVDTINAYSFTIGFILSPGTLVSLHPSLLVAGSQECDEKVLSMEDIEDPIALERGVLDVDGRVSYSDKYENDVGACPGAPVVQPSDASEQLKNVIAVRAWKLFTVWRRCREEAMEVQLAHERGGRERIATLYYLRGCCTNSS